MRTVATVVLYSTDYGTVVMDRKAVRQSGATWRKDGMPKNRAAWLLHDFLTYAAFDDFMGAECGRINES